MSKFILTSIACVLCFQIFASKPAYEKKEIIEKSYEVNADAFLKINNSFGNIILTSWDRNVVDLRVEVIVSGKSEEQVNEAMGNITIEIEGGKSGVEARTTYETQSKSWWSGWFGSSNQSINKEVNYIVKLPASLYTDLNNDYGKISIDYLTGPSKINCDYGQLDIGQLHHTSNKIYFDYSPKSRFEFINKAEINADYSGFVVDQSNELDINADYTHIEVIESKIVRMNGDYGSFKSAYIEDLNADVDYLSIRVKEIGRKAYISQDYGKTYIDYLHPEFEGVDIDNDYGQVKIGVDKDANFDFYLNADYGNIGTDERIKVDFVEKGSMEKTVKGTYGKGGAKITVDADYSNIKLFLN